MHSAILSIGSNIGNREGNLQSAIELMGTRGLVVEKVSSFYETEPWGYKEQPPFINAVLKVSTLLKPDELLKALQLIEADMGRERGIKWGPRVIDIDILFYGREIIHKPDLDIPHPLLQKRDFVLLPLLEAFPEEVHPVSGKDIRTLWEELHDKCN